MLMEDKKMFDKIKEFIMKFNTKQIIVVVGIIIIGVFLSWLSIVNFVEISSFFVGLLKIGIAIGIWVLVDIFLLKDIDTISEIKNNNIAYALVMLGYFILIGIILSPA